MLRNLDVIRRVAHSDIPVLILGESGTGKELIAGAIHQNSDRADKRFVAINCAGLSETLLEDELFGHVKGAYTGAAGEREGRFEHSRRRDAVPRRGRRHAAADAGQAAPCAGERRDRPRRGSNEPRRVDVRILSATNSDLAKKVADKEFREDLYFRIKGATVNVPPLRQRREDIPLLIDHFLRRVE